MLAEWKLENSDLCALCIPCFAGALSLSFYAGGDAITNYAVSETGSPQQHWLQAPCCNIWGHQPGREMRQKPSPACLLSSQRFKLSRHLERIFSAELCVTVASSTVSGQSRSKSSAQTFVAVRCSGQVVKAGPKDRVSLLLLHLKYQPSAFLLLKAA